MYTILKYLNICHFKNFFVKDMLIIMGYFNYMITYITHTQVNLTRSFSPTLRNKFISI